MGGKKPNELTRIEVAERLGCSIWRVHRFEVEGLLHARREQEPGKRMPSVFYDRDEIIAFARNWTPKRRSKLRVDSKLLISNVRGQMAKIALPMFEELAHSGYSQQRLLTEVCVRTAADPLLIQDLYRTWLLGLDGAIKEQKKQELLANERERQREHDAEIRRENWKAHQRELKRIEAQKEVELARIAGKKKFPSVLPPPAESEKEKAS